MVPLEPRTDSTDLQFAGLGESSTPAGRSATSEAADLTIGILRQDSTSGTAALTWNSESVLVYMIADLVRASHGRTIEMPAGLAARFDNSLQALVAARRIQIAILEFLACRPGDWVGAAVLVHPAAGFPPAMAQSALRLAEPGQIILAPEVSTRLHNLAGLELRRLPAPATGGTEPRGLSQLIWTSAERLASLRSKASVVPGANPASPVGATMIVKPSWTEPGGETAGTAARSPGSSQELNASFTQAADGWTHRGGAFEKRLAEFAEHRSFITPLKMAVAAAVIVVVGVVLFHPWSGAKVQPKPQVTGKPTRAPVATPETSVSNLPQRPAAPPASHLKPQPPVLKPSSVRKPPVTAQEIDSAKKPEDTPIQGFEGSSTYDGMTRKDIPRLLQWARSDAGNGNYAKAAQEYRVILQLEPSNPDAREGLRKIQVAQGHEQ